ncbi:MAG TPA: phosphatase PAP2 family protein [Acidimicrobiales bacterium]|nr:phosphatase PAP2 family protein [Acidimicrobiales bacterium]
MLLPWDIAAESAAGLGVVTAAARATRRPRAAAVAAFTWEAGIVLGLYALWQWAGSLGQRNVDSALIRGEAIWHFEQWLHWPSELSLERLVLPHRLLSESFNVFYMGVHVPALVIFLIWLFVRHRESYARWRNTGALLTGMCLAIQFIPVAPPRLLPQLGFVDMAAVYGQSVYGDGGLGAATQVAAMPSMHVAWACLVAVAAIAVSRSPWRWLVLAHPILTLLVVAATANHWWLDGVVALALLPVAFGIQAAVGRVLGLVRRAPITRPSTVVVGSVRHDVAGHDLRLEGEDVAALRVDQGLHPVHVVDAVGGVVPEGLDPSEVLDPLAG